MIEFDVEPDDQQYAKAYRESESVRHTRYDLLFDLIHMFDEVKSVADDRVGPFVLVEEVFLEIQSVFYGGLYVLGLTIRYE
jgi:hypothetical protein